MGTADFAVPSLRALVAAGHRVLLVVSQPDRPGHRFRLTPPPVKLAAGALGLEVFQPERIGHPESVERVRAAGSELIVVAAYGQILPGFLLGIPPRGAINVHGSLLPAYRGAAPVARAILNGDEVTGVTIIQMDEQMDHGPVLARRAVDIRSDDDTPTLTARLAEVGAELLVETISGLDSIRPVDQDHAAASFAPRIAKAEGELDWNLPAIRIDRAVRAFRPWPGVTVPMNGERVKLIAGAPVPGHGAPGQVLERGAESVVVACAEGAYRVDTAQRPGRRPLPAALIWRREEGG